MLMSGKKEGILNKSTPGNMFHHVVSYRRSLVLILCTILFLETQADSDICNTCNCNSLTTGINCARRNLLSIPQPIPTNVEYLDLRGNNIATIKEGTFTGLSNLKYLDLGWNNIATIKEGAFTGLSNLKYLYLHNNPIEKYEDGAFLFLPSIVKMNFSVDLKRIQSSLYYYSNLQYNNLMKCGCHLPAFVKYIKEVYNITVDVSGTCQEGSGKRIPILDYSQCQNYSLFQRNLQCQTCSGIICNEVTSCPGTEPVCRFAISMNGAKLKTERSCSTYRKCVEAMRNNTLTCNKRTNGTSCTGCCVGHLCNKNDFIGLTKSFVFRLIFKKFNEYKIPAENISRAIEHDLSTVTGTFRVEDCGSNRIKIFAIYCTVFSEMTESQLRRNISQVLNKSQALLNIGVQKLHLKLLDERNIDSILEEVLDVSQKSVYFKEDVELAVDLHEKMVPLVSTVSANITLNHTLRSINNLLNIPEEVLAETEQENRSANSVNHEKRQIYKRDEKNANKPQCVYWDESSGLDPHWSLNGCNVSNYIPGKEVTCSCDRLKSFAVLMDVYQKEGEKENANYLSIVSNAGFVISFVCLVFTIIIHVCFRNLWDLMSSKVLVSLCSSLAVTYFIFLVGMQSYVQTMAGCKVVAGFLHYFLLTSLACMSVEAFHVFLSVVVVFKTCETSFMKKSSILAWGLPAVIVTITLAINNTDNYTKIAEVCWLSEPSFHVAFLTPVVIILIFNFILISLVTWRLISPQRNKRFDRKRSIVRVLGLVGLLFLFGLTWVFAFFAVSEAATVFRYLFLVCNTLQGIFIFVFYCLYKKDTRDGVKEFVIKRKRANPWKFTTGKSTEDNYATIPDEALTNEEQYAEASGPSYLELKPADMKISYVNVSRKPDANEEQYAEASGPSYLELKPAAATFCVSSKYLNHTLQTINMPFILFLDAVEEQCAEVSEPKYLEMGQRSTDGTYVNASNKPAGSTESILSNDVTQLISRKDEILKRLPEHFKSVSNQESTRNAEELVEHPSLQETSTVIEKLSNGKDLGQDDIPIEVCKHGSRQIVNKLCKLICLIWETGSVPQQFKDACIMHLYKNKRKRSQCDNPLFQ
ncbi:adhesion G-protein coupled receptor G6-like [Octopus vulgaris]|uniref:Adhesion G-protein coupled receptor G6-like n=1 Tax=Octopus vulgaris TaxID=6645 RepID=A0AA36HHM8_OCTVU|nr:adhesion G-protein coupled receptor G6-like [Octopus vulgaris]